MSLVDSDFDPHSFTVIPKDPSSQSKGLTTQNGELCAYIWHMRAAAACAGRSMPTMVQPAAATVGGQRGGMAVGLAQECYLMAADRQHVDDAPVSRRPEMRPT